MGVETVTEFAITHTAEVAAIVAPFIGWGLNHFIQNRARLIQSKRHQFTFLVQEPLVAPDGRKLADSQVVNVISISVFNQGRVVARNVEVVFNWKPQFLNVWPTRSYVERTSPDRRYSIIFDSLAPKEVIGFELMAINNPLPELNLVRSDDALAINIPMVPQPVPARWKLLLAAWLMFCGVGVNVYALAVLIRLFSK